MSCIKSDHIYLEMQDIRDENVTSSGELDSLKSELLASEHHHHHHHHHQLADGFDDGLKLRIESEESNMSNAPILHKVTLEDLNEGFFDVNQLHAQLEHHHHHHHHHHDEHDISELVDEESVDTTIKQMFKWYKIHITVGELNEMLENSVLEQSSGRSYRYLTGSFMRVFEHQVELFEKMRISIQKRNNIVYEDSSSSRNHSAYVRINGDCKLCPKSDCVKYVFVVRRRPASNQPADKLIEVDVKCKGVHKHGINEFEMSSASSSSLPYSKAKSSCTSKSKAKSSKSSIDKSANNNTTDRLVILAKKRKLVDEEDELMSIINSPDNSISLLLTGGVNSTNGQSSYNETGTPSKQSGNQSLRKLMLKLDQVIMKLSQIDERLGNLEKKFDLIEVTEI